MPVTTRRRTRNLLGLGQLNHRSLPNLDEMIEPNEDGNINQINRNSGDYGNNILEDFIPIGEMEYQTNRLKEILISTAKITFVTIIILHIACLFIDPTPIYKAFSIFSDPIIDCDDYCQTNYFTNDLKIIQHQLKTLQYQIKSINEEVSNITNWKLNLEYDVKNKFSKTKGDTLEYISSLERKMVNALSLYDADKLGIIDYALESAGGMVISIPETTPYPSKITYVLMGIIRWYSTSNPKLIIQPSTLPGECFAFYGSKGRIWIKLSQKIQITSVTLEHTHRNLVSDNTSCPKDFKIYGLRDIKEDEIIEQFDLGTFTYLINGNNLQNFKIEEKLNGDFEFVELRILSNYGNVDYTCVYRFRVHGSPVI